MDCSFCGNVLVDGSNYCPTCGRHRHDDKTTYKYFGYHPLGRPEEIPSKLSRRFNWGGFFTHWVWAAGNIGVWRGIVLGVLFLVCSYTLFLYGVNYLGGTAYGLSMSVVNYIGFGFVLGIFGNRLAWKYGSSHDSIGEFVRKQQTWALVGIVLFIFSVTTSVYFFF